MLLEQEREIEALREENFQLKEALEKKKLVMEESGSIAEAALRLSGVFEAAQKAADMYLTSTAPTESVNTNEKEQNDGKSDTTETVD